MARKAQDPLGDVRAVMTDNTIAFKGGEDEEETSYGFQIQPVYSLSTKGKLNIIARGIVPIAGIESGVVIPPIGEDPRPEDASKWGLGDIMAQVFFSPKTDGSVKWGIGPQVSFKSHTTNRAAGPGWGAGVAGVIFGGAGQWALGSMLGQHFGDNGDFSIMTVQPIILYNFKNWTGGYLGYNNSILFNWNAESKNAWTVPLGLTLGRTMLLKNGDGLDLSIGGYPLVARPEQASKWQLKLGVSYFFN